MQQDHHGRQNGDDAQTADLDQHQDHHLTENAPGSGCRHRHQARHAGGSGGGKQRIQVGHSLSACGADGQAQQQTTQKNHTQKTEHDRLCCGERKLLFHRNHPS